MTTQILSDNDVRRVLGLSKSTMSRLRTTGEIGFFRLSEGRVGYSETHITDFLNKAERPALKDAE